MRRPPRRLRRIATTARTPAGGRPDAAAAKRERAAARRDELTQKRATAARYRGLGGRRGQRRRFAGRILYETPVPPLELATGHLEAVYPFQVASRPATNAGGILIGPSATGGMFTFDPWVRYAQGKLSNPNILVLGDVGAGKSSLVKTLVWRGLEFGRGAHIIDPKGEYGPLADAAGTVPIDLRPGGDVVLNPLDPGTAGARLAPTELFHRNLATLRALLEAVLGRACRQLELVLAAASLARVAGLELTDLDDHLRVGGRGQTVTLPMVAEAMIAPDSHVAGRLNMDPARVVDESRELALAAARLVDPHGDLGGMFAGPTTLDTDQLGRLTVVDIRHIYRHHRPLLPLVMIAVAAWLQLAGDTADGRGRFQVNDEAWALLSDEASARWLQTNAKLSRALSLSVVNVLHRLSDTAAAGNADTATRALAEGVIADAGTWIIYRQSSGEQPLLRDVLQLNTLQARLATRLGRGRGLWVVNGEQRTTHLVDHLLSPAEQLLVDTDTQMAAALDERGRP
ncbi:helicase HerA domain-containing protein [Egicoccus sp. AB-alg6-2]|uniref:helicase HerA domain-containing protein n=1 Tax=Egicoccus sp. AB-alg6-2 TaxID=3242692 RepID=UPI00359D59C1